ncbi:phosphotransferase [Sinomonas sp. ASV322]|uniref:phosphotransferase enzyme family protein n=1 Tax=Sinomonas sp. ASV322 TaxID=3041920 RepID=UPI0027DD3251|nr:phosphotransferase [Sinomonas sp. ASV322]MDQ4504245.1 phosphotransferase [Sinomonas sp. ASV322]
MAGTELVLAQQAVAAFGCAPGSRVTFVTRRENHVFRVANDDGDWALKLHRPGYRTDREIESEAAMCELMASAGVRVPVPVRSLAGPYVAHVGAEGEAWQATMQAWVREASPIGDSADVFLGESRPSDGTLRDFGRTMALMHRCAETAGTPEGYERPAWDAEGLVGEAPVWGRASELPALDDGTRSLIRAAEERLAHDLRGLERSARSYGPIHADLTMENVLRDEAGLVVIDFDDMGEGWYVFDIATACFFFTNHPEAEAMIRELMAGYAVERSLAPQDALAWHPLLLARALTYLAWSVERPDEEATAFHIAELVPRIAVAARNYLETGHTGWADLPVSA